MQDDSFTLEKILQDAITTCVKSGKYLDTSLKDTFVLGILVGIQLGRTMNAAESSSAVLEVERALGISKSFENLV